MRRDTLIKCIAGLKSFIDAMSKFYAFIKSKLFVSEKQKGGQLELEKTKKSTSEQKQPVTSETIEEKPSKKSDQIQVKTAEPLEAKTKEPLKTAEPLVEKKIDEALKTAEHLDDYVFNKVPLSKNAEVPKRVETDNKLNEQADPENDNLPEYYFRRIDSEEHLSVRMSSDLNPRCRQSKILISYLS